MGIILESFWNLILFQNEKEWAEWNQNDRMRMRMGKSGARFWEWSRMRMNHSGNEKTDFILEWVMLTAVLKNGRILAAQHTNWEAKNKKMFSVGSGSRLGSAFLRGLWSGFQVPTWKLVSAENWKHLFWSLKYSCCALCARIAFKTLIRRPKQGACEVWKSGLPEWEWEWEWGILGSKK